MDSRYFHEALRNWQARNQDSRTWEQLSQTEQSEIMSDAQELKKHDTQTIARSLFCTLEPLSIDEILDGSRRSR
jgi:hypothetical protein